MMTRRALLARQEQSKLQLALKELKASKELCSQLNSERDDNEKELLGVLKKNDKLKSELASLHISYTDIVEERDRLQLLVDRFDECRAEYEEALSQITTLQRELRDAHHHITELEEAAHNTTALHTQSLYEELVYRAPQLIASDVDMSTEQKISLVTNSNRTPWM
ncbi:jg15277 [Pararge aegeria aegeria]|uniref:Jg15277 protein n=1 Tax=Pararge aegeria aegeria TaxID=348720 RepID=A0A8S4R641_9NEOP|nr:jg15277 [Pararge aegeria aegeria]